LHDLRHTAAYRMARDPQLPLTDVQWVLGHAHLSTTQLYLTPMPGGDDPGAEPARGRVSTFAADASIEDQADLVGAADVEVVVQDLLEEDPPGHRTIEHLGQ
jgi:hypothetical protein